MQLNSEHPQVKLNGEKQGGARLVPLHDAARFKQKLLKHSGVHLFASVWRLVVRRGFNNWTLHLKNHLHVLNVQMWFSLNY